MIVGIDVGGTFTDAALLEQTGDGTVRVAAFSKRPTTKHDLAGGIVAAFDALFEDSGRAAGPGCAGGGIERITVSTTLCTNAIVSGTAARVAALVMPGPGVSARDLIEMTAGSDPRVRVWVLRGYVDHRGREVEPLDAEEVRRAVEDALDRGFEEFAVAGKFSTRNACQEDAVAGVIGGGRVTTGHSLSGSLNFPRRVSTAILNSAVRGVFEEFLSSLSAAFGARGVSCPVHILRADGGAMPASHSAGSAVRTILSGPAASIAGAMALAPEAREGSGVTVDIGGTTTDVSFFVGGSPLFEPRGAEIGGRKTLVRALYSRSIGIGGDSPVRATEGRATVGVAGHATAAAFGGDGPALTDALIACGMARVGDVDRALDAIRREARAAGMPADEFAAQAVTSAVEAVAGFIRGLLDGLRKAPAYTVRDVVSGGALEPTCVIGIGAPAHAVVPLVARELGMTPVVPRLAPVGNAVGAALAVPSFEATLRIDTSAGTVAVAEDGILERLDGRRLNEADAAALARQYAVRRASRMGTPEADPRWAEVTEMQWFNVVRDFHTVGRIFDVRAEFRPPAMRLTLP